MTFRGLLVFRCDLYGSLNIHLASLIPGHSGLIGRELLVNVLSMFCLNRQEYG